MITFLVQAIVVSGGCLSAVELATTSTYHAASCPKSDESTIQAKWRKYRNPADVDRRMSKEDATEFTEFIAETVGVKVPREWHSLLLASFGDRSVEYYLDRYDHFCQTRRNRHSLVLVPDMRFEINYIDCAGKLRALVPVMKRPTNIELAHLAVEIGKKRVYVFTAGDCTIRCFDVEMGQEQWHHKFDYFDIHLGLNPLIYVKTVERGDALVVFGRLPDRIFVEEFDAQGERTEKFSATLP